MADEKLDENLNDPAEDNSAETNSDFSEDSSDPAPSPNKLIALAQKVLPKVLKVVRSFFSIKVTHVLYALGALVFCLFVFLLLELKHHEEKKAIIGYVMINHKAPKGIDEKDLPEEAQEHIHNYKDQQRKLKDKFLVIKEDRRSKNPVLGSLDQEALSNDGFYKILKTQDLGKITQSGVEKPENMNLSGYDLSRINYKYWRKFIGADMRYTNFSNLEEEGLSFRGSSLAFAQFVDALIPQTNFIRTHLSYTNFYSAVLDGSSFIGVTAKKAHFKEARMVAVNFKESKIIDSDFSDTHLDQANFKNCFLTGSNFSNSKLRDVNFKNAKLQGSSFVNCDLTGADFTNASLEGVDFSGANLLGAKFTDADVTQAKFLNAQNVTLKQLQEVKFLLSARSIPKDIIPKKKSWLERFNVPHDVHGLRK